MKCWIPHVTYWVLYCKWKAEQLCGYRMAVNISVVYPCDWWLSRSCSGRHAQHHKTVWYWIYWSRQRSKCKIQSVVSIECVSLPHTMKSEAFKSNHLKLWIVCTLEKAMAPHSSTLAWKIPWMEEPSRLRSMGSLRVGHNWATSLSLSTFMHWRRKWQPTPVFLPGESQGRGSLIGYSPRGRKELDTTEVT